ncbi:MAG: hypothetical protein NTW67_04380 [Candidatus Woesearchaeota archaeon]|nr:hypothetical protein [Candidatus Woesearchaeota archaeon]
MADIIFTSITTPVGIDCEDLAKCSSSEHIYSHLEYEQDVFGARAQLDHYPLDLIASNIRASSVVLHWPTMKQLLAEIRCEKPLYVAMQVTAPTFERAENMTRKIKELFPEVKVIYGGYAPEKGSADELFLGEGVSRFREFLGEEQREITHPLMILKYGVLNIPLGTGSGVILANVGCGNKCDFCATSHYHNGKKTALLNGEEVNSLVSKYVEAGLSEITMFNEDHLEDKVRNESFHKHVKELKKLINITCFGTTKSVRQYKPEELFDLGYHIWAGFEDFSSMYSKNNYDEIKDFVETMHAHGILLIASSFIGDPKQTLQDCKTTIDRMIELAPYTMQMNIKTPFPGTPFHEKVHITDKRYKNYEGNHLVFEHPTITKEQMEALQLQAQKRDYFELGPSIIRALAISFKGYKTFKNSGVPRIRQRVEQNSNTLRRALPLIDLAINRHPNPEVKDKIRQLRGDIISAIGKPSFYIPQRILVNCLGMYESARISLERRIPALMRQPKFKRNTYENGVIV